MASYHLHAQVVKRSQGRSVVAAAAYRAGAELNDERQNKVIDFSHRRGVFHSEILAPKGSAPWLTDREKLWNYVERIEKRCDAQLAREINVALPHELTDEQRLVLLRAYVLEQFVSRGMVADVAVHKPVKEKGDDPRNHHAHILLTLRQAEANGLRAVKTREWNSEKMLEEWHVSWVKRQNEALRQHGHSARVDHRSLVAQREDAKKRGDLAAAIILDRAPEIHVGPKARKAALAGPPVSRDRLVGPKRRTAGGEVQQRALRYTTIDRGSRGEWNVSRLMSNAQGIERFARKTERRLARFRSALLYYEREIHFETERFKRPTKRPQKKTWKPWVRPVDIESLFISDETRLKHLRRRHKQVNYLIRELDAVFRILLGVKENTLSRRIEWEMRLKHWRPREDLPHLRGRARVRVRFPSLP